MDGGVIAEEDTQNRSLTIQKKHEPRSFKTSIKAGIYESKQESPFSLEYLETFF